MRTAWVNKPPPPPLCKNSLRRDHKGVSFGLRLGGENQPEGRFRRVQKSSSERRRRRTPPPTTDATHTACSSLYATSRKRCLSRKRWQTPRKRLPRGVSRRRPRGSTHSCGCSSPRASLASGSREWPCALPRTGPRDFTAARHRIRPLFSLRLFLRTTSSRSKSSATLHTPCLATAWNDL